jgi:hypothetical protein
MAAQTAPDETERARLLALLLTPQATPTAPATPQTIEPAAQPQKRVRRGGSPIGKALAYLAALALGAGLWVLDGYFSLLALKALGLPIVATIDWPWQLTSAALLSWAIPLGIEAIEQVFFGERGWPLAVFAVVAIPNILATGFGIWTALEGRSGLGVTLAEGSPALAILAIGGGLALSFGPGRLVLAATRALWNLVR